MFKYGVFSGPYFPVFGLNTRKDGPENTPYLDTFQAVLFQQILVLNKFFPVSIVQVVSCKFTEICHNSFFIEHIQATGFS